MKAAISFIVLRTVRPQRLVRFYSTLFGWEFEWHEDHGPSPHYSTALPDGVVIEIYKSSGHIAYYPDRLGFIVDTLPDSVGGQEIKIIATPFGRQCSLHDTDGRMLILLENKKHDHK